MNNYLVDTNIVMHDPCIFDKLDGHFYICKTVLEELDKHKTRNDEIGRNIREFARRLAKNDYNNIEMILGSLEPRESNDVNIILSASMSKSKLLTNDNIMVALANLYKVDVERVDLDNISNNKEELFSGVIKTDELMKYYAIENELIPNSFVLCADGLFSVGKGLEYNRIKKNLNIWGLKPLNLEQNCIMESLMNPDIKLITIAGNAGSGKTLLSIASMFEQTINSQMYDKMLISRPIIPMGNDIGYLPGDMGEKLAPWMQPIFDNIEVIMGRGKKDTVEDLIGTGILEVGALTYIRGRSISNQIILIDESQNASKHEIKTILTRVGEGTKIILTGDVSQIDNPSLDSVNNGLAYVIEKFKDQSIASHITLQKCERSELAEISCEIL